MITGIIEGFYGRPWNARQRHQLFVWMREWGLNTYLYAPKDDRKHRSKWRELYDEIQLAELSALVRDCQRHGIRFAYAIAPGLDIRFTSQSDLDALLTKVRQMLGLGARAVALLFDDIPAKLHPDDAAAFGTAARAQAATANLLQSTLGADLEPGGLWFCPTQYCSRMAGGDPSSSSYLRELGASLNREIEIFWTGPEIIAREISSAHLEELARVLGRKPLIWDNLHANDYDTRRLHLGPFCGRDGGFRQSSAGWLINPNCEFEANFVGAFTFAEWTRKGVDYDAQVACSRALEAWSRSFSTGAGQRLTVAEIQVISDWLHLPYSVGAGASRLLEDVRTLVFVAPAEWGGALERFRAAILELARIHERLCELENRDLLHALYRQVWDLKEALNILLGFAEWRQNGGSGSFVPREFSVDLRLGGSVALLQSLLHWNDDGFLTPGSLPSQKWTDPAK